MINTVLVGAFVILISALTIKFLCYSFIFILGAILEVMEEDHENRPRKH